MLKHLLLPVLAILVLAAPASAQQRKREAFEVAIDNALERLKENQLPDGSWTSGRDFGGGGFGGRNRDPAISALCVMAFLSAGHVPGEGKYGHVVEKGVRFVCSQQQRNGVLAASDFGMTVMYSHGISTLMLAEVIGLMPDRKEAAILRKRLEAAVQVIRAAQSRQGGWRYSIQPVDADMSVTAWQVMALRAAKNVGCDVPAEVIDRAVAYVQACRDPRTGGYRYTQGGATTLACTGASILSLELCGKQYHGSAESRQAAQYIKDSLWAQAGQRGPAHVRGQQHFFYGVYYMSQAMFQIGGEFWDKYRQYLHWLLLHPEAHAQKPDGSWTGVSGDDHNAGVNYCTAMAVLALTVEYRFLPIYQRGEEAEERGK
ncbi:MAG TPA: prenyltransferase/squalene oxidase repeat-containing protein [Gemmataceae bacterium]|nr:prenyltransferase/squalene oxidase repeat-containing protein [Gemmataceae bacterium]